MAKPAGRVAIVTGGSRGIGRAIAQRLAADGLNVVVNYRSQSAAAREVVESIEAQGGAACAVAGDIANEPDRAALVQHALNQYGRLDVLINNAGITSPGRLDVLETTPHNWDAVFDTNLKGAFFLSQLCAREMIRRSEAGASAGPRCIVNVSSISAFAVSLNRPEYCIAKAGLEMMTQLFATRLADAGILVYDVCPGVIASDMTEPVRAKYDALIQEGLTPIRRWGAPDDVARAVAMLVRGELPFSTGNRIHVDGGFHMRRL